MRATGTQIAVRSKGRKRARFAPGDSKPSRLDLDVTVLAGGVGAAKFLRGLVRTVDPARLSIVVNTADDEDFFGLRVCPDIDTVIYTLAGVAHPRQGWGRAGDTFTCLEELSRFFGPAWFNLGDRDLATHIFRSQQLAAGASLSAVTADIARLFGLTSRVIPMTDQRVRTVVETARGLLPFQEYFVKHGARPAVKSIAYRGVRSARPAPGVISSIMAADVVLLAPSNPIVSIGPILSLPGVRSALGATEAAVAAVSPIIGRSAVTGPAARMMRALGISPTAKGVASLYRPFLDLIAIDHRDAHHAKSIERTGARVLVSDILIPRVSHATLLARRLLERLTDPAILASRAPSARNHPDRRHSRHFSG